MANGNGKAVDPGPKIRGANEAFKRYLSGTGDAADKLTHHIEGQGARVDAAFAATRANVTAHADAQVEQLKDIDSSIEELEKTNAAPLGGSSNVEDSRPLVAGQAGSGGQQT